MLVSALGEGDERRAIDNIMTRLRSLVEETGAGLILVSHLRRVDGNKGHENGIEVSLSHLRGSNSIGQLSDCVIALERNQQSDDADEARTTRLREDCQRVLIQSLKYLKLKHKLHFNGTSF
jgi:twinkle protein